jgi:hypothetical protein
MNNEPFTAIAGSQNPIKQKPAMIQAIIIPFYRGMVFFYRYRNESSAITGKQNRAHAHQRGYFTTYQFCLWR